MDLSLLAILELDLVLASIAMATGCQLKTALRHRILPPPLVDMESLHPVRPRPHLLPVMKLPELLLVERSQLPNLPSMTLIHLTMPQFKLAVTR